MRNIVAFCLRNKLLKLLSLGMALAIWILVSQKSQSLREVPNVAILFRNAGDNFILNTSTKQIQKLHLRGPALLMSQLQIGGLVAEIDLQRKERDEKLKLPDRSKDQLPVSLAVPIAAADIRNLPPNVTVSRVEPDSVTVTLDHVMEKQLTVVLDRDPAEYAREIRKGFRIHKIYITPLRVTVSGPKSVLDRRETIKIRPLPAGTLDAVDWRPEFARDVEVDLDVSDDATGLRECLTPRPPKVKVWVQTVPIGIEVVRENVPVTVHGLPGFQYILLNETKTSPFTHIPEVRLRGDEKLLAESTVRAQVDLTDIMNPKERPEVTRDVSLTCAPEIEILTRAPKVVIQIRALSQE